MNAPDTLSLHSLRDSLKEWLVSSAYPLWAKHGVDAGGGFAERLDQGGRPLLDERRARVAPRQIFSFALAPELGWRDDVEDIVRRGLAQIIARYRRPEGLYRTLITHDGRPKDEHTLLYDQAFVLLSFAAAARVLASSDELERHAVELRDAIDAAFREPQGGFRSGGPTHELRESNPHMHLFEACLAWTEIGRDPAWARWADEIAELALGRFINPHTGALSEVFTPQWEPAPGPEGRRVEPGHQFEWAWLLLRWKARQPAQARRAALRLIEIGEQFGVRDGYAINALRDDFTVQDPDARLWPQAERLKAGILAAQLTGSASYLTMAAGAANALASFFATPVPGLWLDRRRANGEWIREPSPASSFYHIVGAIHALERARAP